MDQATVLKAARFMAECAKRNGVRVDRLVLFGSHAHGEGRDESDIDLAIVSPDFSGKDVFERAALLGDAEIRTIKQFRVPLDVVTMSPEELAAGTSPVAGYVRSGETIDLAHA